MESLKWNVFSTKDSNPDMAKFLILYRGTISTTTKYRHRCLYVTWFCRFRSLYFLKWCCYSQHWTNVSRWRFPGWKHCTSWPVLHCGILPELLGKWYTRSDIMPSAAVNDSSSLEFNYCYCEAELGGSIICCENVDCSQGQWFHLICFKLKSAPRCKKWYCPYYCKLQTKVTILIFVD